MNETVMIALSCVLFVTMGLADAIQEYVPFRLRILTCPKCLTFWSSLLYNLIAGQGVIRSIAVSFIIAYIALWAALIMDAITVLYNYIYEKITRNEESISETEGDCSRTDNADGPQTPSADEMP